MSSCPFVVALACGAAMLVGCGSSEQHAAGPWRSGFAADASFSGMSDRGRQAVCKSLDTHLESAFDFEMVTRLMCSPGALLRARTADACEFLVNGCMRLNAPDPLLLGARVDAYRCVGQLVHCTSSVGALEACINQNIAQVHSLLDGLSCDRVGDRATLEQAARSIDITKVLTTCAGLAPSCQNVIEDAVLR